MIQFGPHEAIGITGARGCGKSTLAGAIAAYYKQKYKYKIKWAKPSNYKIQKKTVVMFDDWTNWSAKDRSKVEDYLNRSSAMLRHIGAAMVVITHHPSILPKLFRFSLDRVIVGRTPSHAGAKYIEFWVGKHPEVKALKNFKFLHWDKSGRQAMWLETKKAKDQLLVVLSPSITPGGAAAAKHVTDAAGDSLHGGK